MIKLHKQSGDEIWINPTHIVACETYTYTSPVPTISAFQKRETITYTKLSLITELIYVIETPEQINLLINPVFDGSQ